MSDMKNETDAARGEEPLRKLNPQPKRAYTITMTLADAPGPFASVEGVAHYSVTNSAECGRKIPIAGAFPSISTSELFTLTRVSDTEYVGTVYADLIVDEDYFGRGICRWEFTSVSMHLRATTNDGDTRFIPNIHADAVLALGSDTKYFWKARYPRVEDYDGFPVFGETSLASVPESRRGEFFTITLAAKEAQP